MAQDAGRHTAAPHRGDAASRMPFKAFPPGGRKARLFGDISRNPHLFVATKIVDHQMLLPILQEISGMLAATADLVVKHHHRWPTGRPLAKCVRNRYHIDLFGSLAEWSIAPVLKAGEFTAKQLIYKEFFASFPQLAEIISATPSGCSRFWKRGRVV